MNDWLYVGDDKSLTIQAGATVRMASGVGIAVQNGGLLQVQGSEDQRVVFTSDSEAKNPGQWQHIRFEAGSTGTLAYCDLEYGGAGVGGIVSVTGGASLVMTECIVGESSSHGILLDPAEADMPPLSVVIQNSTVYGSSMSGVHVWRTVDADETVIRNNVLRDNAQNGVMLSGLATVSGNDVRGNGQYGVLGSFRNVAGSVLGEPDDNLYSGNTLLDGIGVGAGDLKLNGTFERDGGAYRFNGSPTIDAGNVLVVAPGVEIQFPGSAQMTVASGAPGGRIEAIGTEEDRILLTSSQATKGVGEWERILFLAGSSGELRACDVECGGGYYYAPIKVSGKATLVMDRCTVSKSGHYGVQMEMDPGADADSVVIRDSMIQDNVWAGIYVTGTSVADQVVVVGNTIKANQSGVRLDSPASVTGNTFEGNVQDGIQGAFGTIARSVLGSPDPNTFISNGLDEIVCSGGGLSVSADLERDSVPYRLNGYATVKAGAVLAVPKGVQIRFAGGAGVNVEGGGRLLVSGGLGAGERVSFSGSKGTEDAGQWERVWFMDGSSGSLANCDIEHGGGYYYGAIKVSGKATLAMNGCGVRKSAHHGIQLEMESGAATEAVVVEDCVVRDNVWSGIHVSGTGAAGQVVLQRNVVTGVGQAGFWLESPATVVCNSIDGNTIGVRVAGAAGGAVVSSNSFGGAGGSSNTTNLENALGVEFVAPRNWWGSVTDLKVLGNVSTEPILGGLTPQFLPEESSVGPLAPEDGKVHSATADIVVAFDRGMDTSTTQIQLFRVSPNVEPQAFPLIGDFDAEGRIWTGKSEAIQNGGYEVRVVTPTACTGNAATDLVALTFEAYLSPPPHPPRNLAASSPDNQQVVLTWEAPEPDGVVAGYRIRRDGALLTAGGDLPPDTFTFTDDPPTGQDDLDYEVTAVDGFGQESIPLHVQITLDNSPPVVTVTVNEPKEETADTTFISQGTPVTVCADDTAGVTSLQYNIGGGDFAGLTPPCESVTFPDLPDGAYILTVLAEDALDNAISPLEVPVTMDKTAPAAAVDAAGSRIYEAEGSFFIAGGQAIRVVAPDGGVGADTIGARGVDLAVDGDDAAVFAGYSDPGVTLFSYSARDKIGNTSAARELVLNVITEAPVSAVTVDSGGSYLAPDGTLYVRGDTVFAFASKTQVPGGIAKLNWEIARQSDGVVVRSRQVTGAPGTHVSMHTWMSDRPEGAYVLRCWAEDRVGNVESLGRTQEFTLDRSPPETPVLAPTDDVTVYMDGLRRYAAAPFKFTVSAGDLPTLASGLLEITCTVTGLPGGPEVRSVTDPSAVQIVGDSDTEAEITIALMAKDNLNQVSVAAPFVVTLDPTPLQLALVLDPLSKTYATGETVFIHADVNVTIASMNTAAPNVQFGYRISRQDGSLVFETAADPDTPYALAGDPAAGGVEPDEANILTYWLASKSDVLWSATLYKDTQAPAVSLAVDQQRVSGGYVAAGAQFTIAATDAGSGVNASSYKLQQAAGGAFAATGPVFQLGGPDRSVQLTARAADNVGNEGLSTETHEYAVDGTAPVTSLMPGPGLAVSGGSNYAPSPWTFTIQSVDNGSGVEPGSTVVKDNGAIVTPQNGVLSLASLGGHNLTFSSRDKVGNIEPTRTYQITLVGTKPDAPPYLNGEVLSSQSVMLTWGPTSAPGVRGFHVYRRIGEGDQFIAYVPVSAGRQFTATGLIPLADATFTVRAVDTLNQLSDPCTPATLAPNVLPPVITAPNQGALLSTLAVVISGKAEAGAEIRLSVGGAPKQEIATAGANGSFSAPYTFSVEGQNALSFFARVDTGGGVYIESAVTQRSITIDLKPAVPTILAAEALDTRVRLRWTRITTPDVVEYRVYRDGNLVPLKTVPQPVAGTEVEIIDLALSNGRRYGYRVEAVDAVGNRSGLSMAMEAVPVAGEEWGEGR